MSIEKILLMIGTRIPHEKKLMRVAFVGYFTESHIVFELGDVVNKQ